ncbi:hypothetical protein V8C34DRAFT_324373 [Trichoderma compactum]
MKLINVHNLKLEEHVGNETPPYAILSHTWGADEVTLQEWQKTPRPTHKAGFRKILNATRQAELDGLEYLWVDTNCIDKTSSAELSDNINSMFAYYSRAAEGHSLLLTFDMPVRIEWTNDRPLDPGYQGSTESFDFQSHLSCVSRATRHAREKHPAQNHRLLPSRRIKETRRPLHHRHQNVQETRRRRHLVRPSHPPSTPAPPPTPESTLNPSSSTPFKASRAKSRGGEPMRGGVHVVNTGHVSETSAELGRHSPKPILGAGIPIMHRAAHEQQERRTLGGHAARVACDTQRRGQLHGDVLADSGEPGPCGLDAVDAVVCRH